MAKKVISFIVILLVFCTAGAAVLIGTSNFGLGFGGMTENPVSSAYALDRAGDIYYVNRTSTGMELVCVDSTGKRLFEKKLDPAVFGGDFTVSGIYVEHDKGIYLTVYEYDPETDTNYCEADLDEDDMERFLRSANDACPFYRPGDEYRTARRQ